MSDKNIEQMKAAVLNVHPDAYARFWGGRRDMEEGWAIRGDMDAIYGSGATFTAAWADAYAKLPTPEPQEAALSDSAVEAIFDKWDDTFKALAERPQEAAPQAPHSTAPETDTVILDGSEYRALLAEIARKESVIQQLKAWLTRKDAELDKHVLNASTLVTDLRKKLARKDAQIAEAREFISKVRETCFDDSEWGRYIDANFPPPPSERDAQEGK